MESNASHLDALQDIKKMMEKSSRFISLSGWSGVSAGICALIGAWIAHNILDKGRQAVAGQPSRDLEQQLMLLAAAVFICAFISAFLFTWIKSRRSGLAIWSLTARRLLWNTMLPMIVGGFIILRMIADEYYSLIAATALLFYGLALVNGSKYTLGEVRYVGYIEIALGIACLALPNHGLLFWTIGFGVVHIIYGIMMWSKYERTTAQHL